jgi:Zn-dependent protease
MTGEIKLGRLAGLQLSAMPSAIISAIGLWTLLTMLAAEIIPLSIGSAILGGLIAVVLHYMSETLHQLGHALAAKRTGYPMIGIRFWFVLGTALYPPAEPSLPGRIHIQRALGGPIVSVLIGAIAAVLAALSTGLIGWIIAFLAFDNLVVLGLGAFVPLGFTDGSTILTWWGKR